ncbi:hypothetical protein [Flavimaricola marinus]|uniref:DUF4760 domain-containing protein n=1 Tax=Flavimaricola marinus TaxID=1819565 RepID=A0A238LA63_9RHOB|nr:hypothetical protein [Flavimaricola marinus]SMY06607.1 hypothetical protein LOM8899_00734 [Flavimaricola marinus]
MTLSEFTPIADLLAAMAVILTVAFLAYEIRASRKQAELSNWRELLQTLVDFKSSTNDLVFADLVERGHQDYAALTPAERRAFGLHLEQGVHIYGNFLKHNNDLPKKLVGLDDACANMFHDLLTTPGGAQWWAETRSAGRFMPATYAVIDEILRKGRRPTAPPLPG